MKQLLTVFHINKQVTKVIGKSFESILRDRQAVKAYYPKKKVYKFKTRLFIAKQKQHPPEWAKFLKAGFRHISKIRILNQNALLTIKFHYKGNDEAFAFTFGQGRFLLKPGCYDRSYGLRAAINLIYDNKYTDQDTNRIKSLSSKTITNNPIRKISQADRKTTKRQFDFNERIDELSGVTGTPPESGTWGGHISGRDSLTSRPTINFRGLLAFCKRLVDAYKGSSYEDEFSFLDNQKAVTDDDLKSFLKGEVLKGVKETIKKSYDITLAIPEHIDYSKYSRFYFSWNEKDKFTDPEEKGLQGLQDSLSERSELERIGILGLQEQLFLCGKNISGEEERWSIFECLSGQISYKNKYYVLSGGEFYEVRKSYMSELNRYISALPKTEPPLLPCDPAWKEKNYNNAQACECILNMDRKNVNIPGRSTPVEICDLLMPGCFVHVKCGLSSDNLSHLFSQGYVPAELILSSPKFREEAQKQIKKQEDDEETNRGIKYGGQFSSWFSEIKPNNISPRRYEVCYAIIAHWKGRNLVKALPFFSKVNLRRTVEDLRRMGYRVTYARIMYGDPGVKDAATDHPKRKPARTVITGKIRKAKRKPAAVPERKGLVLSGKSSVLKR